MKGESEMDVLQNLFLVVCVLWALQLIFLVIAVIFPMVRVLGARVFRARIVILHGYIIVIICCDGSQCLFLVGVGRLTHF